MTGDPDKVRGERRWPMVVAVVVVIALIGLWAKIAMAFQSLASITILGLVIARAVKVLS